MDPSDAAGQLRLLLPATATVHIAELMGSKQIINMDTSFDNSQSHMNDLDGSGEHDGTNHMDMEHEQEGEEHNGEIAQKSTKSHQCKGCNRYFSSLKGLQQHVVIHTNEKPFVCDICEKAFRFKSNLFEHKSLHKGTHPYVCQLCGKTCRLRGNLKKHLKTHQKAGEIDDMQLMNELILKEPSSPKEGVYSRKQSSISENDDSYAISPSNGELKVSIKRSRGERVSNRARKPVNYLELDGDQIIFSDEEEDLIASVAANHFAGINTGSSSSTASSFVIDSEMNSISPRMAADMQNMVVGRKSSTGGSRRKSAASKEKLQNEMKNLDELIEEYQYLPFEENSAAVAHCDLCPLQYRSSNDLLSHYKEKHADRSDLLCEKCIRTIPETQIVNHKKLHQLPLIQEIFQTTALEVRDLMKKGPRLPKIDNNRR